MLSKQQETEFIIKEFTHEKFILSLLTKKYRDIRRFTKFWNLYNIKQIKQNLRDIIKNKTKDISYHLKCSIIHCSTNYIFRCFIEFYTKKYQNIYNTQPSSIENLFNRKFIRQKCEENITHRIAFKETIQLEGLTYLQASNWLMSQTFKTTEINIVEEWPNIVDYNLETATTLIKTVIHSYQKVLREFFPDLIVNDFILPHLFSI